MGARETTPTTTHRPGQTAKPPLLIRQPRRRLFLAPDDRPPLAGIKLVRPRPSAMTGAYRCGRSSLTPGRATAQTSSDEESHHNSHLSPAAREPQVTGSDHHAP
jgi:hypothetical protein